MQSILYRPLITEKTLGLASRSWYTFAVDKYARKEEIAREIEKMYHVNVINVRTVSVHGKVKRTGKKMIYATRPDWKKAMAQVKAGQHIDAFDVTQKPEESEPVAQKAVEEKPSVKKQK